MRIKTFFQKSFAVTLSLAMCLSMYSIVFAADVSVKEVEYANNADETLFPEKVVVYQAKADEWTSNSASSIGEQKSIVLCLDNQYEDVYTTESGQYFRRIDDENYIPSEKVNVALRDYDGYKLLKYYDLPSEVMNDIASMAALAEENGCTNAEASIFVSEESPTSSVVSAQKSGRESKIKTTWNGKTFYSYQIYFTNMWTTWQTIAEKSATTKAVLSAIKNLAMNAAGSVSTTIGVATAIYSGGVSCLDAWKTATGKTPIYGNTSNKVMVDIKYDIYLKYTYYYDKMDKREMLGCSTQRAKIREIDTDTYLYSKSGGKRLRKTVSPNKVYYTPNFISPEKTAYNHRNSPWTEKVTGKVYSKKVKFVHPSFSWPSGWPKG